MNAPVVDMRRRALLQGGALTIGFALGGGWTNALAARSSADETRASAGFLGKTVDPKQVDGYLSIGRDGTVTAFTGKVDLGTGVQTALMQMVAEELDVPPARIRMVMGDSALTPDQGPTSGSNAVQIAGMQLRQAGATARQALLALAAERWQLPVASLSTADGAVVDAAGRRVGYGELIGERTGLMLALDPKAVPKDPARYRIVGTSVARLDIPDKVAARFEYMQDFRTPGMLHGRVVRPPGMGATLLAVDEGSIAAFGPKVRVVRVGNFLGVVAPTEWTAIKAARALKVDWSAWSELPEQDRLWEHVRATRSVKDEVTSRTGDATAAFANLPAGSTLLKATYEFPIHTHGSIGPSCAVADFRDGQLTCWTASQATHNLRKQLATMIGLPPDKVRTIYIEGAGCYGRNGHEDAAGDAALMARAVGRPVRVQWMRDDEHGWDPKGPPTLVDMQAAIDPQGQVLAWQGEFFVPDGVLGSTVPLVPAGLADLPHETGYAPGGITSNSAISYRFPNVLTVAHRLADTPFKPSWIRSPGRLQNCFANECFLDEITRTLAVDPIDYRIAHLDPKNVRGIEVLQRLAALSDWKNRPASQPGEMAVGRGVAFIHYDLSRAYVGMVAEVEVNRRTGAIRARRFFVVQDAGQVINPEGTRSQIEGNVIQTLSRTLKEELTFDRSTVTSRDWNSYPILTFPEVPEIVMELVDRPADKPLGAGEPSTATVTAAVANAVYDAIGVRLRSVPFRADRVMTAMRTQGIVPMAQGDGNRVG